MGGLMMALLMLSPALHAQAASSADDRARLLYSNGRMLFDEERYDDALLAWQEAYALSGRPLLLYNIALAHEKLGNYGEAVDLLYKYRVYATPDEQQGLIEQIAELQVLIDSAPEDEPVPMPAVLETPAPAAPATVEVAPAPPGPSTSSGATLAWASAGVTGSVGVVFTALTIRKSQQAQEFCSDELGDDTSICLYEGESDYIQLERFANIADVSVGLSILSTGAALWLSSRSTSAGGHSGPVLWVGPGRLGIKGSF
jgi:tetratricopeptide (TPR) repeat protein